MWSSPCRSGKWGLRGDIPKHSFGVSCSPLEPSFAPTASPKEAKQHLVGPPSGQDSWGSNVPHIQDPWEAGPGQPSLGSASPHAVSSQLACTGQLRGEGAGGDRWREAECPHCCQHPTQGHLSRPWSHLWEAGTGRARGWPSQVSGPHGLGIGSPLPSAVAAGDGPDQHPKLAAPRVPGCWGLSRPNAHPEPGHLNLGHPSPLQRPLLCWPWGGCGSRAPGGRHLRLAEASRLRAAVPYVPVPRPQVGIRGAFESWGTSHSLPQLLSQGLQPAGALSVCGQTAPSGCSPRAGS